MRRVLRSYAQQGARPVERGFWRVAPRHALRSGTVFSQHLTVTKWLSGGRGRFAGALALIADVVFGVYVDGGRSAGATVVIRGRSGDHLLLAPEQGYVDRIAATATFDERYGELRAHVARYLSSPDFEIDETRRVERSRYVDGVALDALGRPDRVRAMRSVLRSFTELASAEQRGSCRSWVDDLTTRVPEVTASMPASLQEALADVDVLDSLRGGGLVPSHGDASARNVVVSDGSPYLIDFTPDRMAWRPWWFDALYFVFWGAYPSSIEPFWAGAFDRELAALFMAGRGGQAGGLNLAGHRSALAAFTLAIGTLSHGTRRGPVGADDWNAGPPLEAMWTRWLRCTSNEALQEPCR